MTIIKDKVFIRKVILLAAFVIALLMIVKAAPGYALLTDSAKTVNTLSIEIPDDGNQSLDQTQQSNGSDKSKEQAAPPVQSAGRRAAPQEITEQPDSIADSAQEPESQEPEVSEEQIPEETEPTEESEVIEEIPEETPEEPEQIEPEEDENEPETSAETIGNDKEDEPEDEAIEEQNAEDTKLGAMAPMPGKGDPLPAGERPEDESDDSDSPKGEEGDAG